MCDNSCPDLCNEQEQQQSGVGLDHRTVFLHNPTAAQETDKANTCTCGHGIVASLGVLVLREFRIMVQLDLSKKQLFIICYINSVYQINILAIQIQMIINNLPCSA